MANTGVSVSSLNSIIPLSSVTGIIPSHFKVSVNSGVFVGLELSVINSRTESGRTWYSTVAFSNASE